MGLVMLAGTSMTFAKNNTEVKKTSEKKAMLTECYVKAYDANGRYLGLHKVPCPKVIILHAK